jgi:hypothetical protein
VKSTEATEESGKGTKRSKKVADEAAANDLLVDQFTELGLKEGGGGGEQAQRAALPIVAEAMTFLAASVKNYSQQQLCNLTCDASADLVKGLGTTTPYVVVGMYFTGKEDPVVYPLKAPAAHEPQCLGMAVNNAYRLRSDAMGHALHNLLSRVRDPVAQFPKGVDVGAKKRQGVEYYGTLQDADDLYEQDPAEE